MLALAYDYQDDVEKLYSKLLAQDRFKWTSTSPILDRPDWEKLRSLNYEEQMYISLRNDTDNSATIMGIISYSIDHWRQAISGFTCVRVGENEKNNNGSIFMKDMLCAIHLAFYRYHFRKMSWSVIIGNPAEKSWDKFCNLSGGRIIGISKDDAFTADHVFRDVKHYELFAKDFYETSLGKNCIKMFKEDD